VGPGNHVLDGGPDPLWEGAILWREGVHVAYFVVLYLR